MKERRKHFLINKPLQFRYMAYMALTLLVVSIAVTVSLYFGIWSGVLDAFSDEQIRTDLLTASRIVEYEKARLTSHHDDNLPLSFFRQTEKMSAHQREVFKGILDQTNRKLMTRFLLLMILITWASIYLTHKIAGPLYRFHVGLSEIGQGNLTTRIRLRKGDEAQAVAKQFNRTTEYLDHFVCRLKNIIRENKADSKHMTDRLDEELAKVKTSVDL
jgi:methyl-accepting chemotaxis protein